jgi:HD-GYP domain-containing protein (c-di-GMP phosphodiesterase class II)
VLLKEGPLSSEEWSEMRRHPSLGWELVRRISFLADAARVCKEHHERWDGKGYPDGLAGEQICIGARIFSVVDAYDAITSDRPYRKARSSKIARDEIARHAGTQFDPRVAQVFLSLTDEEIARLRQAAEAGFRNVWTGLEGKGTKAATSSAPLTTDSPAPAP